MVLLIVMAYFLGAVPFAYLLVRWRKGVDIRTVGSGNVGATNAGRLLGFRYFLLIFVLDVLKGLLPTWLLPRFLERVTAQGAPSWFPVLVALATILGHNFPIYLRFKGGKGVATSLGAFAALEPAASVGALLSFLIGVVFTRYVSLSSVVGALVFFLVYFGRTQDPWGRDLVMSVVTIALVGMLIVRHSKNFARIWQGTEPKVPISRRRTPPAGKVRLGPLLVLLALPVAAGTWAVRHAWRVEVLDAGPYTLRQVARASTGHQRASRLTFYEEGHRLALLCPRYERLVLFQVGPEDALTVTGEVQLGGRPMALAATSDHLLVLERPSSDRRHLEPGWVDMFGPNGESRGSRFEAGVNPDDLAITPDGRSALVLTGARTEGDGQPPTRFLLVFDLQCDPPRQVASLDLGLWEDEPGRIHLAESGKAAVVAIHALGKSVAVDLTVIGEPRALKELPLPSRELGYLSSDGDDRIVMPVASPTETIALDFNGGPSLLAGTCPRDSAIEAVLTRDGGEFSLGRLRLRGPLNLGEVKPTGLAWSPERRLLAVAAKSGAVHLLALTEKTPLMVQSTAPGSSRR
jgi:glycerol-3-phosphate acyltransferase PlsY